VGALAALVMRLVRTLHGNLSGFARRDRYAIAFGVSSRRSAASQNHSRSTTISAVSGVHLLPNLPCDRKRPSATYAKFSPVDNS
jgi:hypothetical protein